MSTPLSELLPPAPEAGLVKLDDGNLYRFSLLNLNAQAAIEEHFGIDLLAARPELDAEGKQVFNDKGKLVMTTGLQFFIRTCLVKVKDWRYVAWQLLLEHHPMLTEERVGQLLSMNNLQAVMKTVLLQIANSMPLPPEAKNALALHLENFLVKDGIGSI